MLIFQDPIHEKTVMNSLFTEVLRSYRLCYEDQGCLLPNENQPYDYFERNCLQMSNNRTLCQYQAQIGHFIRFSLELGCLRYSNE